MSRFARPVRWLDLKGEALEAHYIAILNYLGRGEDMLGVVFRKAQNRIQDPAKLRRLVVDLIDRVVLHPARDGASPEIELIGEIATMLDMALGRNDARDRRHNIAGDDLFSRSVKVVAGTRNHRQFRPMMVFC